MKDFLERFKATFTEVGRLFSLQPDDFCSMCKKELKESAVLSPDTDPKHRNMCSDCAEEVIFTPEYLASFEQARKEYERGEYKTIDELKDLTKD
jgi:hypothetical protein